LRGGLNAGISIMNLKLMREYKFEDEIREIYNKYKNLIQWADQDLLNIYMNKYPGELILI
jgi:lipopolysaccharide biosynthesis glycosyltransferase